MPPIKLKLNLGGVTFPSTPGTQRPSASGVHDGRQASEGMAASKPSRQSSPYTPEGSVGLRMGSVGRDDGRDQREHDDESDDEEEDYRGGGPSPAYHESIPKPTIRLNLASLATHNSGATSASSATSTPMSSTPVSTPGEPATTGPSETPAPVKRKRGRPPKKRPSAIPPHLVTTPKSLPTGLSTPMSEMDMQMDDNGVDPLSLPLSPQAGYVIPVEQGPESPSVDGDTVEFTPRRTQWKRVKRPFNELANKVMAELRRKDAYGFFFEPVSLEEYPDYWNRIGGEDKAMDFGTMQNKLDTGVYKTMDDLEVDFRKVIDAAKAFNAPGTMPVREAQKIFTHGIKHIDRSRPLVLTPSPSASPSRTTPALPESTRSTPHPGASSSTTKVRPTRLEKEVKPEQRIPSDMLEFPPNSLQAKAVAWNQTGGRIVRPKRFVRGRERFVGHWRDFCLDGTRDVAEMDDPALMLEIFRSRKGSDWRQVVDWPKMRKEDDDWWEWDGLGGPTGQPPLPGADRLKPKPLRYRELDHLHFGPYPELKDELRQIRKANKPPASEPPLEEFEALENHLRPAAPPPAEVPKGTPAQTFVNIYERKIPTDFLYNVCVGGVRGEAYTKSVERFLDGALGKRDEHESEGAAIVRDYAARKWHGGVLQGDLGRLANDTVNALHAALASGVEAESQPANGIANTTGHTGTALSQIDLSPPALVAAAEQAYTNLALRDLTSPLNPLDLAPLLRDPSEFLYPGIGGRSGVLPALDWISSDIQRQAREQDDERAAARTKAEQEAKHKAEAEAAKAAEELVRKTQCMVVGNGQHVVKSEDPMDVDSVGNGTVVTADQRVKRSSAELEFEDQPEAKRSRVASPDPSAGTTAPAAGSVPTGPTPADTAAAAAATALAAKQRNIAAAQAQLDGAAARSRREEGLRQLRLELVAVSKFYPLASLRKMSKEQAKALLPASVRNLMTLPEDKEKEKEKEK